MPGRFRAALISRGTRKSGASVVSQSGHHHASVWSASITESTRTAFPWAQAGGAGGDGGTGPRNGCGGTGGEGGTVRRFFFSFRYPATMSQTQMPHQKQQPAVEPDDHAHPPLAFWPCHTIAGQKPRTATTATVTIRGPMMPKSPLPLLGAALALRGRRYAGDWRGGWYRVTGGRTGRLRPQ
jgi:hypothetical protein